MSWIIDSFKGMNLTPEFVTKLSDLESKFAVLERENVNLKLEVDKLRDEVEAKEGKNQELKQENERLRKTTELAHTDPLEEEFVEPERVQTDIRGNVSDSETGENIHAASIRIKSLDTQIEYQTASDRQGQFRLPVPFGVYTATISCNGYFTVTGSVHVTKQYGGRVDFARMVKAPPTVGIA